jgi:hypothetical protein
MKREGAPLPHASHSRRLRAGSEARRPLGKRSRGPPGARRPSLEFPFLALDSQPAWPYSLNCYISIRVGQPVRWDPKKETIVGNGEAKKMMNRPMCASRGVKGVA